MTRITIDTRLILAVTIDAKRHIVQRERRLELRPGRDGARAGAGIAPPPPIAVHI